MTPWLRSHLEETPVVPGEEQLTVGEVASLVGVSIRTLHHWDEVGLVQPESRTSSGYRAYSAADMARIHRVLVYQELGFSLASILGILDDPEVDAVAQLRQQRDLIDERIARLQQMAQAIERVLESHVAGTRLTVRQHAEIFGRGWREEWTEEAYERWGESDEWSQFEHNAAASSETDLKQMQEAGEELYADMAQAKRSGIMPGSITANLLAERHLVMVSQLFECTYSMQVCLGRLYVEDERFGEFFAEFEPGLAEWVADAINENARQHEVDPDHAVWE